MLRCDPLLACGSRTEGRLPPLRWRTRVLGSRGSATIRSRAPVRTEATGLRRSLRHGRSARRCRVVQPPIGRCLAAQDRRLPCRDAASWHASRPGLPGTASPVGRTRSHASVRCRRLPTDEAPTDPCPAVVPGDRRLLRALHGQTPAPAATRLSRGSGPTHGQEPVVHRR